MICDIISLRSWRDSRASAFVLVAKLWTRVAKPWEDWWRDELNSRLPKFVGFFELCVHQCTRISDWLRVLKRQSIVNLYLSSFPGEKGLFSYTDLHIGSFGFSEYPNGKQYILKEEQERAVKEPLASWFRGMMWKLGLTSLHDYEILRFVTLVHLTFSVGSPDLFVASLVFMKGSSCYVIRRNLK